LDDRAIGAAAERAKVAIDQRPATLPCPVNVALCACPRDP
jgi:hypothetical protein